jgi:hypothetical protein
VTLDSFDYLPMCCPLFAPTFLVCPNLVYRVPSMVSGSFGFDHYRCCRLSIMSFHPILSEVALV